MPHDGTPERVSQVELLRMQAATARADAAVQAARAVQLATLVRHRCGPGDRIDQTTGVIHRCPPIANPNVTTFPVAPGVGEIKPGALVGVNAQGQAVPIGEAPSEDCDG